MPNDFIIDSTATVLCMFILENGHYAELPINL